LDGNPKMEKCGQNEIWIGLTAEEKISELEIGSAENMKRKKCRKKA
jgi:hypothetical protein